MTDHDQFDEVDATFAPTRRDNLKPDVEDFIGRRLRWRAMWIIEDGPYEGQIAWMPVHAHEFAPGVAWVPTEDLTDIGPDSAT